MCWPRVATSLLRYLVSFTCLLCRGKQRLLAAPGLVCYRQRHHALASQQNLDWLPLQADLMEILYRAAKQDGMTDTNMAFQGLPKAKAVFEHLVAKPVQVCLQPTLQCMLA